MINQCENRLYCQTLSVSQGPLPQVTANRSRTECAANELVAQLQGSLIYPYSRRMIRVSPGVYPRVAAGLKNLAPLAFLGLFCQNRS